MSIKRNFECIEGDRECGGGECSSNGIRNFRHAWVLFVGRDLSLLSDLIESREKTFSKPTRIRHVRLWYVCRDSIPEPRPLPPFSISSAVVGKLEQISRWKFWKRIDLKPVVLYKYFGGEGKEREKEKACRNNFPFFFFLLYRSIFFFGTFVISFF